MTVGWTLAHGSGWRVGQLAADAQQLPGRAADRELGLLGRQEVPVHRVVGVDPDAAVHVNGGVRHAMAGIGRPERRRPDLDVCRAGLPTVATPPA